MALNASLKRFFNKIQNLIKASVNSVSTWAKPYLSINWGSPFIAVAVLLLIVAAASLSTGFIDLANRVAIYAYFALLFGVILQLLCFIKYRSLQC